MKPEVEEAIAQLRDAFPGVPVTVREDGDGGAFVVVEDVALGHPYNQESTWVGFQVTFQYPYADVYPYFVRGDLSRADGNPLGDALTTTTWENRLAVQVSRRSNRRDPAHDTAYLKLLRVMEWLKQR